MKLGFSTARLSFDAQTSQWSSAFPALDSSHTLITAFGSPQRAEVDAALAALRQAYPKSIIVGCSTSGEIHDTEIKDHSLSVGIARFALTKLKAINAAIRSPQESFEVGERIAASLNQQQGLRAIFVLSEGLNVNGSELVRGMSAAVGEQVVITGGLAGDGSRFGETWVVAGQEAGPNLVAAVGFYGRYLQVLHASRGGWDHFGLERTVTRAQDNVLYELDGESALEIYERYLGDKAQELPASGLLFPLAIKTQDSEQVLVRTLLGIDREAGAMTFAGDIPVGASVQLMKAHFDRLIDGAEDAAISAMEMAGEVNDGLAIAISCVGRRLVLGDRTEDELDVVASALKPLSASMVGFYSYGELSPMGRGACALHNQTMTLTIFSEQAIDAALLRAKLANKLSDQSKVPTREVSLERRALLSTLPEVEQGGRMETAAVTYDLHTHSWGGPLPALDSAQTLVLAFGAPDVLKDPRALQELARSYPLAHVIGCSSAGEIAGAQILDQSVSATISRFAYTELKSATVQVADAEGSFEAGQTLAKQLKRSDLRAIFVLSSGLGINGAALVRGINSVVDEHVIITGGLAGDGSRFEETWIFAQGQLHRSAVTAVAFYGTHVTISHGSQGGWDSFGPVRKVTRAEGNVVYELDGTPALALYQTYLGDKAKELPASGLLFPLSLLDVDGESRSVVRTLLAIDQEAQSLTFAGDVPQGASVQLMKANFDRLIDGAEEAAAMASFDEMPAGALAVAVSCVGRRLVLGARTEDELEAVLEQLPKRTTLTGFYSYGELSPVAHGQCELHNQTMTLTVFAESLTPIKRAPKAQPQPTPAISLPARPKPPSQPARVVPSRVESPKPSLSEAAPVEERQRIVIPIRSHEPRATPLHMERSQAHGVTTVRFSGKLDEKFNGASFGRTLEGVVVLDLAEVHRVTSFGVREWLSMIKETTQVDELYLARCSEPIASQLSTIRAFSGDAHIVSFFAPYLCERCGAGLNALIDVELDAADLSKGRPPKVECVSCGHHTQALDEDPTTFFSFARGGASIPSFVRDVVDKLPALKSVEPVEKIIDHQETIIRVNAKLDETIRWARLLDGVEGAVSIDLSGASGTSPQGIQSLVTSMTKHMHEAKFSVQQAPYELLVALKQARVVASFDEIEVVASCGDGKQVRAKVNVAASQEALKAGRPVHATSQECEGGLELAASMPLICYAARIEPQAVPEQAPAAGDVVERRAQGDAPALKMGGRSIDLRAVIVIGLVVVLGVVVIMRMQDKSAQEVSAPAATATQVAPPAPSTAPPAPVDKALPSVPDAPQVMVWDTPDGIKPAWSDRKLTIKQDAVSLVGEGRAPSRDAALEAARVEATSVLVAHIERELRGEPIAALIEQQGRKAEPSQLVATFKRQMGPSFVLERKAQAFRQEAGGFSALVLLETSPAQVSEAVALYRDTVALKAVSFGVRFPSIVGQDDFDVIVLKSELSTLQPGDLVLSEAQTPIYRLSELREMIAKKAFLRLVVSANAIAKAVTLRVREVKRP